MTTKWLTPNNGKLSNIPNDTTYKEKAICTSSVPKLLIETEEAQLESVAFNLNPSALSFYRSQKFSCWSKYFEPAQKFDCI